MRVLPVLALAAISLLSLAGCLSSEPGDETNDPTTGPVASGLVPVAPDPSVFLGTIEDSHVAPTVEGPSAPLVGGSFGSLHMVPELHTGAMNLELLDFNELADDLVGPGSGYTEVHVAGGLAVVASVVGSRGATLVDISDPANMQVLSHIYNLDDNWDSRLSDDGKYLFLGCQGTEAFDCTTIALQGEQPSTEGGGPCAPLVSCPGGIAIFDLTEPRAPVFVDYLPLGSTHNVYAFHHDNGKYYVMNENVTIAEWDPEARTYMVVNEGTIHGNHDAAVQKHPVTGQWLLYTGTGRYMQIWNLDDPANPELLSTVEPPEGSTYPAMWHEQTPLPCLIDGRHITVGAGESGAGVVEPVAIVDTTDPTDPVYVGQWELPDAAALTAQGSYRFSLHNIDGNCDGQVAVGHYHAGVWVFDVSTRARQAEPVTLGYYLPHEHSTASSYSPVNVVAIGGFASLDIPNVWAAQWSADGQALFIPDMSTGLYSLTPTWETQAPA